MKRITFSIPKDIAAAAEKRARADRRSLSAHISLLVEKDAQQAGFTSSPEESQLLAAANEVGMDRAISAVRRAAARSAKTGNQRRAA